MKYCLYDRHSKKVCGSRNVKEITETLQTILVGKWSAISEDSCGKTKHARPRRHAVRDS